jgi:superfamily II DNA or RNA helicase
MFEDKNTQDNQTHSDSPAAKNEQRQDSAAEGKDGQPANQDTSSASRESSDQHLGLPDSALSALQLRDERQIGGTLHELTNRMVRIADAIDIINDRINQMIKGAQLVRTDHQEGPASPAKSEYNPEKMAHLRLAKKFLSNILNQSDRFEDSPLQLRINQLRAIDKLIAFISEPETERMLGYFKQPTGAGKTILFGVIARLLDVKTLVLVPRTNLVEQIKNEFINVVGIAPEAVGTVMQGANNTAPQFVIATYQSHVSRMRSDPNYKKMVAACELVVCDEAHRAIGDQTFKTIEDAALGAPIVESSTDSSLTDEEQSFQEDVFKSVGELAKTAAVFAFTATPELAGKSVNCYFKNCIASERYSDMVQAGICVPFLLHQVDGTVREVMLDGAITEEIEGEILEEDKTYDKLAGEFARASKAYRETQDESQYPLRGVAFCANIKECDIFANVAAQHGLRCRVVTGREARGKDGQAIIAEAERALVAGEIDLIVTVKKLAEGWDCKPVNAVIWARACTSAADVVQGIGRTGRAYFDEIFGKKTVSHIFETRWVPKSSDGSLARFRRCRLLGIEGALLRNGEDPRLICSNSDYSPPEFSKREPSPIVKRIFDKCLEERDFAEVFSAVSYFSAVTKDQLDSVKPPTLYGLIKSGRRNLYSFEQYPRSSFENTIIDEGYTRVDRMIDSMKKSLFDLLGEEILKRGVNDELALVMLFCEPSQSTQAFEKLKQQNPSHAILAHLACSSSEHATDCWYLLTQQLPPAKYLVQVLKANSKLELRAWNELKKRDLITKDVAKDIAKTMRKRNPTIFLEAQRCLLDRTTDNKDLREIIDTTESPELGLEAARMLFEQHPDPSDLWAILNRHEPLKEEVLKRLISEGASLASIIQRYENPWRLRAAVTLYQGEPSEQELLTIISHVPEMRIRAAVTLHQGEPTEEGLLTIISHVPEMEELAARRLMARQLTGHSLAKLVLALSDKSLREEAADRLFKKEEFCTSARGKMVEIIEQFPDLRDEAARALLAHKVKREKGVLHTIIKHVEKHRREAVERLLRFRTIDPSDHSVLKKYAPDKLK